MRKFYPAAVALNYSPEVKTRRVLKGQSVIRNGRLQFDAGWTDLAAAFMGIKQTMTASGRHAHTPPTATKRRATPTWRGPACTRSTANRSPAATSILHLSRSSIHEQAPIARAAHVRDRVGFGCRRRCAGTRRGLHLRRSHAGHEPRRDSRLRRMLVERRLVRAARQLCWPGEIVPREHAP